MGEVAPKGVRPPKRDSTCKDLEIAEESMDQGNWRRNPKWWRPRLGCSEAEIHTGPDQD